MSIMQEGQTIWSIPDETLDSKYEKCRNITEEIYKRINITFQIKKLEETQSELSEHSDQIDSNELSNETDLFACDKSDSISSSTEAEKPTATCEKFINNNNNEEMKMKKANVSVYKRPKKRFRKRVKKRQSKTKSDSDGSSDEAPLSRIVECPSKVKSEVCPKSESPDNVMGVPNIVIITKDLKPKIKSPEGKDKSVKQTETKTQEPIVSDYTIMNAIDNDAKSMGKEKNLEWKNCTMCSLSFRGARGLRRHITMSHIVTTDDTKKTSKSEQRDKPV